MGFEARLYLIRNQTSASRVTSFVAVGSKRKSYTTSSLIEASKRAGVQKGRRPKGQASYMVQYNKGLHVEKDSIAQSEFIIEEH